MPVVKKKAVRFALLFCYPVQGSLLKACSEQQGGRDGNCSVKAVGSSVLNARLSGDELRDWKIEGEQG